MSHSMQPRHFRSRHTAPPVDGGTLPICLRRHLAIANNQLADALKEIDDLSNARIVFVRSRGAEQEVIAEFSCPKDLDRVAARFGGE